MTQEAPDQLQLALSLEGDAESGFIAHSPVAPRSYTFGGQVMAQLMVAASKTVQDQLCHSVHAYFTRIGRAADPYQINVTPIRSGGNFSVRQSTGQQDGRTIATMMASFQTVQPGMEHQAPVADDVPLADALPEERPGSTLDPNDPMARTIASLLPGGFEQRWIDPHPGTDPRPPKLRLWMRAKRTVPSDPTLQRAALLYFSDYSVLESSLLPHGLRWHDPGLSIFSLDHSMWFHREIDVNRWVLVIAESPTAQGGRALGRSSFFDEQGNLLATAMQEGTFQRGTGPANA